jgi:hypothetical protein
MPTLLIARVPRDARSGVERGVIRLRFFVTFHKE